MITYEKIMDCVAAAGVPAGADTGPGSCCRVGCVRIGPKFWQRQLDLETLKQAQAASAQWIDTLGTSQTPEAQALRQRIGELFRRAEGTMN